MKSLKQFVLAMLHRFHLEYLPEWRLGDYVLGVALRRLFTQLDVDFVLDIGANEGQYARFLRKHVGYAGPIHSFEPTPELAARLREQAKLDPNWTIHECALGELEGTAELHITRDSQLNSLLIPVAYTNLPAPVYQTQSQVVDNVQVRVRRLDDVLVEIYQGQPSTSMYIKVDTQGFDLSVLRGSDRWLEKSVAVQTELSFEPLYQGSDDYRTVIAFLQERGFAISGIFPVSVSPELVLVEADGIFVRRTRV